MKKKRGSAIVEFAVVMPLLMIVLIGIIEAGWYFFSAQTIQYASLVGARTGSLSTSTDDTIIRKIEETLISFPYETPTIERDTNNCMITVTIVSPYDNLSLTGSLMSWVDNVTGKTSTLMEGCTKSAGSGM